MIGRALVRNFSGLLPNFQIFGNPVGVFGVLTAAYSTRGTETVETGQILTRFSLSV